MSGHFYTSMKIKRFFETSFNVKNICIKVFRFNYFIINSKWEKAPNFRVTYKHYLNISFSHNTTYSQGFFFYVHKLLLKMFTNRYLV